MSNEGSKSLREEMGDGYLNLLDSVRHSFEQAAWGQEGSGNLGDDFYRWAGAAEAAPQPVGPGEGVEMKASSELEASPDRDWNDFEAWIDGRQEAMGERETAAGQEREGPSREGPELGD